MRFYTIETFQHKVMNVWHFCNRVSLWRHSLNEFFVQGWKTLDINAETISIHVYLIRCLQASLGLLLLCFCSRLSFTSRWDRQDVSIVSENGSNAFQHNRVKLRVVTFVYVYFINMQKHPEFFLSKNPFKIKMVLTKLFLLRKTSRKMEFQKG